MIGRMVTAMSVVSFVVVPAIAATVQNRAPLHVAYRIASAGKIIAAPEVDIVPGQAATMEMAGLKLNTAVSEGAGDGRYRVTSVLSVRRGGAWVALPQWESETNGTAGTVVDIAAPGGATYRVNTTLGGGFAAAAG